MQWFINNEAPTAQAAQELNANVSCSCNGDHTCSHQALHKPVKIKVMQCGKILLHSNHSSKGDHCLLTHAGALVAGDWGIVCGAMDRVLVPFLMHLGEARKHSSFHKNNIKSYLWKHGKDQIT